jgi:hypothetical protein
MRVKTVSAIARRLALIGLSALVAAAVTLPRLTTGWTAATGRAPQGHVGATAWYLLAACNGNPYWMK